MGFGPMISSLMRNKTGAILVALQIAVALAVIINSLYIIVIRVEKMNRDPGIDVENVIITFVRGFGEDFNVVNSITDDIDLIKSIPGVVAATVSNHCRLAAPARAPVCARCPTRPLSRLAQGATAGAKKGWMRWASS